MEYADGDDASAFARMLGGLLEANLAARPQRRADLEALSGRVGIALSDIGEAITLDFRRGRLVVANGLLDGRRVTIRSDSDTVMELSSLAIGPLGLPVYVDGVGRGVAVKLLRGRLKIEGMIANLPTLNRLTRLLSVR